MNWRNMRWWLAGFIAYLIFLLVTFPASYALVWWQKRMPEVQLANVSGSVWSGSAQELALYGQSYGALQWKFDWRTFITGNLGLRLWLRSPEMSLKARVSSSRNNFLLRDVRGHMPISWADTWLALPADSVSGNIDLELNRMLLVNLRPALIDGVVNLTNVTLNWPQSVALGDYQIKLSSQDQKGIHGSLLDTSGPLVLQGTLDITPGGHYQAKGTISSREPSNSALMNLLDLLPADKAGNHRFNFSGQW